MSEVLVHVTRNGEVENLHRGDLVVVNLAGEIIYQVGDPYKVTYWRSAAKPFQALPLSEIGGIEKYGFTGEELALMTASHGGEPQHLEVLHRIFEKMNCDIELLDCGTAMPMYFPATVELIKNGGAYTQSHNPCSGKHAAMIALAMLKNYDIKNYIHKDHPVQQEMLKVIAEMTELDEGQIKIGIDGCGVPVFGLPIYNMALAYAKLSKPDNIYPPQRAKRLRQIAKAMVENPYYVAGTKRLDTILMEVTKGKVVAKLGAEAVYSIGIMEKGIGIALKIESGNYDAIDPVIIELLRRLDYIDQQEFDELQEKCQKIVSNHRKEITGGIKAIY